jgi:predicted Rossmann fold nucleotide-binding protein DprA/Smf involved in DNA uptake
VVGGIVQSRSADFASVFLAVTRRPMTTAELVTETGVHAEVLAEVLRIFALTGSVARSGDRYKARHIDPREREHCSLAR